MKLSVKFAIDKYLNRFSGEQTTYDFELLLSLVEINLQQTKTDNDREGYFKLKYIQKKLEIGLEAAKRSPHGRVTVEVQDTEAGLHRLYEQYISRLNGT